jgi:hypothetical protein
MTCTEPILSPPRERLDGGRVRGSLIRSHLGWVRDHCSREETIEMFEAFGQRRAAIAAVNEKSWYDFSLLVEVDRVIVGMFGGGDAAFAENLGAYAAEMIFSNVRDRGGVHDFFRRLPGLRTELQDFGAVQYIQLGINGGRVVHGSGPFSPLHCAATVGFLRSAGKLHGAERIVVRERDCQCSGAAVCSFDIAWL